MPRYKSKYDQSARGERRLFSRLGAAIARILQRFRSGRGQRPQVAFISKQRKKRKHKLSVSPLLFLAVLLLVAGWLSFQTLEQSDIFKLRSISVYGNRVAQQAEILDLGRIEQGMNLLSLDSGLAEERISSHPWIDHVTIKRTWPFSIRIQIDERRPLAMVNVDSTQGQGLCYVDEKGRIFSPVIHVIGLDFPVITGLSLAGDAVGAMINDDTLPGEALSFFRIANQGNPTVSLQSISEINIHPEKGIIVYLVEHPFPIYMGHDNIRGRYDQLVKLLARLYRKKKINEIEEIRMDYQEGRILVAKATP